jgi:pyrroloquinoline quinone biosynthesis protein B
LKIIVLGSAAGGGFPQWNCRCFFCLRYWQQHGDVSRRTQSALAASGDGENWVLLNCSPDIREQIGATPSLHPCGNPRGSPIRAVVLSGGDVDHIGGLLSLREQARFDLHAPPPVLEVIAKNSVFNVLDKDLVVKCPLLENQPVKLPGGLKVVAFHVPGKVPLYLEKTSTEANSSEAFTLGLRLSDSNNRSIAYIPSCAGANDRVRSAIAAVDILFLDGTLWTDDELIRTAAGQKTGRQMGHMPIWGRDGSIAAFKGLSCRRRYFVHINNTNPLNCENSPERKLAEAAGWTIPRDGDEISL